MAPVPTDPIPAWIKWIFRLGAITVVASIAYVVVSATGVGDASRSAWVPVDVDDLTSGAWKQVLIAGEDFIVVRLSDVQANAVARLKTPSGDAAENRLLLAPLGVGTTFANFAVFPATVNGSCRLEAQQAPAGPLLRWTDPCDGAAFDMTGRSLTGAREDLALPQRRLRGRALEVKSAASTAAAETGR